MCRNLVLWPQGQSLCGDQSKSSWLSPRSTYWHIQMPSVYCENRSIGWNNTVTGDNVPERDDLWSPFGFTDSGAFMWFPQQAQSQYLCWCHILLHTPNTGLFFFFPTGFPTAISAPTLSSSFPFFFSSYSRIAFPAPWTSPFHLLAACLGWLPLSLGQLWTFLIYYPKQKWHGISAGWLG